MSGQALGSGILNKERADFLGEVREKMGLSKEAAEKIIKGGQNQHVISGLQVGLPWRSFLWGTTKGPWRCIVEATSTLHAEHLRPFLDCWAVHMS